MGALDSVDKSKVLINESGRGSGGMIAYRCQQGKAQTVINGPYRGTSEKTGGLAAPASFAQMSAILGDVVRMVLTSLDHRRKSLPDARRRIALTVNLNQHRVSRKSNQSPSCLQRKNMLARRQLLKLASSIWRRGCEEKGTSGEVG